MCMSVVGTFADDNSAFLSNCARPRYVVHIQQDSKKQMNMKHLETIIATDLFITG